MPSPIETTIARYFTAIRTGNRAEWVECFAPHGVSHDPCGTPPHVGHDALGRYFDSIVGLVETIGLHEEHAFVRGTQAAVKWTGRGLGKNGKTYSFEGIDVFESDAEGRIVLLKAYWDPDRLMAQLT